MFESSGEGEGGGGGGGGGGGVEPTARWSRIFVSLSRSTSVESLG